MKQQYSATGELPAMVYLNNRKLPNIPKTAEIIFIFEPPTTKIQTLWVNLGGTKSLKKSERVLQ
jgi:hypothetical protein